MRRCLHATFLLWAKHDEMERSSIHLLCNTNYRFRTSDSSRTRHDDPYREREPELIVSSKPTEHQDSERETMLGFV